MKRHVTGTTMWKVIAPRRWIREVAFLIGVLVGLASALATLGAFQVYECHKTHPKADWLHCLRGVMP